MQQLRSRKRSNDSTLRFDKVEANARQFAWSASCMPFWALLSEAYEQDPEASWCMAGDFTHGLCRQGFRWGFLHAIIFRRLAGRTRKSPFPLCIICSATERSPRYADAFRVVVAECQRRGSPLPSQLHIDYFGGIAGDVGGIGAEWKRIVGTRVVNGIEHCTRALRRNQAQGGADKE